MAGSREYHRRYSREYYHRRKAEYIRLLGGKCAISDCQETDDLEFDHVDPKTKSFAIGKLLNVSKAAALAELKKCQLLCHEHHKEKNRKDGSNKKRARGEKVAGARLTEDLVRQIRQQLKKGISTVEIARSFNLHRGTVYAISIGKTWKHVQ